MCPNKNLVQLGAMAVHNPAKTENAWRKKTKTIGQRAPRRYAATYDRNKASQIKYLQAHMKNG